MCNLLAILQIKCRRKPDFWMWLKWYTLYIKCTRIIIIDDASPVSIADTVAEFNSLYSHSTDIFILPAAVLDGAPGGQCRQLRNANIGMLLLNPNDGDIVITPDDDEFWWFDNNVYTTFTDACVNELDKVGVTCITVPWLLISSRNPLKTRAADACYADVFDHVAPNDYNETKFVMRYRGRLIEGMHCGYPGSTALATRKTNEGFGYNYTYCPFKDKIALPVRCYHFRMTTEQEYNEKIKRNINDKKHTRFYAKGKNFYNFDEMMYRNWPGYTVPDTAILDIMARMP